MIILTVSTLTSGIHQKGFGLLRLCRFCLRVNQLHQTDDVLGCTARGSSLRSPAARRRSAGGEPDRALRFTSCCPAGICWSVQMSLSAETQAEQHPLIVGLLLRAVKLKKTNRPGSSEKMLLSSVQSLLMMSQRCMLGSQLHTRRPSSTEDSRPHAFHPRERLPQAEDTRNQTPLSQ